MNYNNSFIPLLESRNMLEIIEIKQTEQKKFIEFENFIVNWTQLVKEMDEQKIGGMRLIKEARKAYNPSKIEICPRSINNLHHVRKLYCRKQGYNFMDTSCCLVGEGHRGNNNYCNCLKCKDLAGYDHAGIALTLGGNYFLEFKREFYNHMIEKHSSLMVKV